MAHDFSNIPVIRFDQQLFQEMQDMERQQARHRLSHDPIREERMLWYAQLCCRISQILPGQTILELHNAGGALSKKIHQITRGENPITSLTLLAADHLPPPMVPDVEWVNLATRPEALRERQFDLIVGALSLEEKQLDLLFRFAGKLLKPGGRIVLIINNPWNLGRKVSDFLRRPSAPAAFRNIRSMSHLHRLIDHLGFERVYSFHYDFVYPLLTPYFPWFLRNASILLENLPLANKLSRSVIIHAQKPPQGSASRAIPIDGIEKLRNAVSVVIPCHNEEANILLLVTSLKSLYGQYLKEIILVDDNSRDQTREIILSLSRQDPAVIPVIRRPPNGVGRALRDGYRVASGEFILSMDCDFIQILPEFRELFEAIAEGYDVVVGSRFSRHRVLLNYPWLKIVANRSFHLFARIALGHRFRDLTNNLKIFRREMLGNLELKQDGFAINAELGLKPLLHGYSVKEIPVSWINRTPGMGQSSFRLLKVGKGYLQVLLEVVKNSKRMVSKAPGSPSH